MSKQSRAQINSLLDSITGLALRLGIVAVTVAFAYLIYVVFGPKLAALKSMKAADKDYLVQSVGWAQAMLKGGAIAIVFSLCVRCFYEETIGLILTLVGSALYLFSPAALNNLTLGAFAKEPIYLGIVNDVVTVGLVCLAPGIFLLVRGLVARVICHFGRHEIPATQTDGDQRRPTKHKLYEMCWNMACCSERVKRFCPAWEKRKPCWQIKAGCMCDEEIIRKSLLDRDGETQVRQQATAVRPKAVLSAQQKKERCRCCTIYIEHQRQKFRIASPSVMGLVALTYALLYGSLSSVIYKLLENMDRFMSFMTYRQGTEASFASQGHIVTTLAMICLGVVILSFTLRALEYLIFDLQV